MALPWTRTEKIVLILALAVWWLAWLGNLNSPLQGIHSIRQADTLFAARSYCVEHSEFLKPRIAHRGDGAGINIGEFPVVSWMFSLPCQLRGEWDEARPKILSMAFFLAAGLLWGLFWRRRNGEDLGLSWIFAWIFPTYQMLHGWIPIPDSFALLCFAAAGLASLKKETREEPEAVWEAGSVLLFMLGFSVRPYLIPLWLLVQRSRREKVLSFIGCALIYFVWYRWWIPQWSEFPYYATGITPLSESLPRAGEIARAFIEFFVRDLTQLVWLVPLTISCWRKEMRPPGFAWIALTAAGSLAMVLCLRGPQIVHHSYYLGSFVIAMLIWMAWAWAHWTSRWRPVALIAFLLVTIGQTQHEFHRQGAARAQEVQALIASRGVALTDKIAVYVGDQINPPYLYWAERVGWSFPSSEFRGATHCPAGAAWALFEGEDGLSMEACH